MVDASVPLAEASSNPPLPFSRPCINEAAALAVAEVVRSGWITSGPKVIELETQFAAFTGAAHAIAVCSATAAMDMVFQALDLKPGDEVIMPSINWVSGPNMVELNGGRCVFAEVDPTTLNIDLNHVERLINARTRAIMPVHFAGAPVDLDRLRTLIAGKNIIIVEDAAHAAGARQGGKAIGGDSDVAIFSFHPSKNMTTAEGGMITCRSAELADRLKLLRFHGIRKDAWKNHARSGKDIYQVQTPGRKYNLPDMLAVLGIHQLADLERMNAERARLAMAYQPRLRDLSIITPLNLPTHTGDQHAWHIFVVLVQPERLTIDRAGVIDRLEAFGIGTALHFPAAHRQTYYSQKYPEQHLPISADVGDRLLSIPLFPGMTDADLDRVAQAFQHVQRECGR